MERVLVTGGNGFFARFCLRRLSAAGYALRTTVRSSARADALRSALEFDPAISVEPDIVIAELGAEAGWAEAVAGCTHVIHTASPLLGHGMDDESQFAPLMTGATLRLLDLSRAAGVRRFVLTSSSATVCYGQRNPLAEYDETHWTDTDNRRDSSAYGRAKTHAEQAAWKWLGQSGGGLELVAIQPGLILGPVWDREFSPSVTFVASLIDGSSPGYADLGFQIVDARDLADLHLLAMTLPQAAGQRFLGTGEFAWSADAARLLRARYPGRQGIPTRRVSNWILHILALWQPLLRDTLFELGKERRCPGRKAAAMLDWHPRDWEQTVVDTAESLISVGIGKGVAINAD